MNNNSIRTQQQFIELLKNLIANGKQYQVDKLSNRIIEIVDGKKIDKEKEALYEEFCEKYNVVLNDKMFLTLFRGYLYNYCSKEELDNLIKDDFYYSILEFINNKSEVTMNDLCHHLFNLSSNKVKQELRSHIARCLTAIGCTSKRTNKGIKWIKEPTQPTLDPESISNTELQLSNEPTQKHTLEGTLPTPIEFLYCDLDYINKLEEDKKVLQYQINKLKEEIEELNPTNRFACVDRFSYR